MSRKNLLPCKTCPWRKNNDASVIPGYDQGKADRLLNTIGNGDDFRNIMACHKSKDGNDIPCKGYLAQEGDNNLNVRLLAIQNKIPYPRQVRMECGYSAINLEPNYLVVLQKLRKSWPPISKN